MTTYHSREREQLKELLREKKKIVNRVNLVNAKIIDHPSTCECKYCNKSIELAKKLTNTNIQIRLVKESKSKQKSVNLNRKTAAIKAETPIIPKVKSIKKSKVSIENYEMLIKKGVKQKDIAKYFELPINKYYDWKREMGLLPSKKKEPVNVMATKQKDATKELLSQIKKMQEEIEPVHIENQKLKEEIEESIQEIKSLNRQLELANKAKQLLLDSDISDIMVKYIHSLDLLEESEEAMIVLRNLNAIKGMKEINDANYAI